MLGQACVLVRQLYVLAMLALRHLWSKRIFPKVSRAWSKFAGVLIGHLQNLEMARQMCLAKVSAVL